MEIVFNEFRDRILLFFESLGNRFSELLALKTSLEPKDFFVMDQILSRGSGEADLRPSFLKT